MEANISPPVLLTFSCSPSDLISQVRVWGLHDFFLGTYLHSQSKCRSCCDCFLLSDSLFLAAPLYHCGPLTRQLHSPALLGKWHQVGWCWSREDMRERERENGIPFHEIGCWDERRDKRGWVEVQCAEQGTKTVLYVLCDTTSMLVTNSCNQDMVVTLHLFPNSIECWTNSLVPVKFCLKTWSTFLEINWQVTFMCTH